jgi:peptidoglycan hydrolase-like protein with peptidoglycan-binding domain
MKISHTVPAIALSMSLLFSFTSPLVVSAAGPAAINLATAGNFVVLTKTGISTTGATSIVGNIGVSPAPASYITGFGLILPATSAFSTSALINGNVYAPDYANPTPANLTTAILDMQNAYTDGQGRAAGVTELGAGNIGGLTLAPDVYRWGTGVTIPTNLTLSGGPNDVWIFQIAQNLNVSSSVHIVLSGGAQASNVFWVVAGQTTIGTGAIFNGTILDQTAIVLNTGAQLNGRALAQTAATIDSDTLTIPAYSISTSVVTPTPTPVTTPVPTVTPTMYVSSDANVAALQTQLNGLVATAQSLQAQVQARQSFIYNSNTTPIPVIRTVAEDLTLGSRDSNVAVLQQFLISQNTGSAAQSLGTVGATGYFGALTQAALVEFQTSMGISPARGYFGPITKAFINAHY